MSTITGPKVQMPQVGSPFVSFIEGTKTGELSVDAGQFLHAVQSIAFYSTRSGPTGSRPTSTSFRWIGMPYFDTSLGLPVYLKTASSSAWVKADGTAA